MIRPVCLRRSGNCCAAFSRRRIACYLTFEVSDQGFCRCCPACRGCECGLRVIVCSRQRTMTATEAVMDSLPDDAAGAGPLAVLSRFRVDFHACVTAYADELSELADA